MEETAIQSALLRLARKYRTFAKVSRDLERAGYVVDGDAVTALNHGTAHGIAIAAGVLLGAQGDSDRLAAAGRAHLENLLATDG